MSHETGVECGITGERQIETGEGRVTGRNRDIERVTDRDRDIESHRQGQRYRESQAGTEI